jgi:hypothetical protein
MELMLIILIVALVGFCAGLILGVVLAKPPHTL